MVRNTTRLVARAVFPAFALLALGAAGSSAAPLSPAVRMERPMAADTGKLLHEARHRHYRYYGDDFYFGYYPFTLNDYPPYVAAHPPRYYAPAPRYRNRTCSYWSQRCVQNWGANNSNYYGCMRYQGC